MAGLRRSSRPPAARAAGGVGFAGATAADHKDVTTAAKTTPALLATLATI